MRQVFDLSGFSKLFVITPDLQAALRGDTVAAAAAAPNVARTAADLLGAGSSAAAPRSSSSVGRQAADLLGAKPAAKPGFWARLLAWFKGQ